MTEQTTLDDACPEPAAGEGYDRYMQRCIDEVSGYHSGASEDAVMKACELAWELRPAVQAPTHNGHRPGLIDA